MSEKMTQTDWQMFDRTFSGDLAAATQGIYTSLCMFLQEKRNESHLKYVLHAVPSYKERLYKEHQLSQKNLKNKDQLTFGQLKNEFFKSTSQSPLLKEHQTGKFVKMLMKSIDFQDKKQNLQWVAKLNLSK